jgi:hypothetical protein
MELTGLDQLWCADITYIRLETRLGTRPDIGRRFGDCGPADGTPKPNTAGRVDASFGPCDKIVSGAPA